MATLSERNYLPDWLFSECEDGRYTRDTITVLAGSGATRPLTSGMVLGKATAGAATAAAYAGNAANTGTCGSVTVGAGAKPGVYQVVIIEPASNAGKFTVEDPDGIIIGTGTVGVAFSAGGLGFTIADGATDFIAGEGFTITVAAGTGKWVQIDFSGTLGTQNAAGILVTDVTAPDGSDISGAALVRGPATIIASKLTWPSGATTNQKNAALAQLAVLGIVQRSAS